MLISCSSFWRIPESPALLVMESEFVISIRAPEATLKVGPKDIKMVMLSCILVNPYKVLHSPERKCNC